MEDKKNSCIACNFIKNGIKTRKNIPHTCDNINDKQDLTEEQLKDIIEYAKGLYNKRLNSNES